MPRSELVSVTAASLTPRPEASTTRPPSVAVNAADDWPYRGWQPRNRTTRAPSNNPSCRKRTLPDIRKPSSKFWLTPGLHPYGSNQRLSFTVPRQPQINFQIVRVSTRTLCVGEIYRGSRAGWQRFSGKATRIRAIRLLTAAYNIHISRLADGIRMTEKRRGGAF